MPEQSDEMESSRWTGDGPEYDQASRSAWKRALKRAPVGVGIAGIVGSAYGHALDTSYWVIALAIGGLLLSLAAWNFRKSWR